MERVEQWGGHHERKTCETRSIHPDAEISLDELFASCSDLTRSTMLALDEMDWEDNIEEDVNNKDAI
eukprot:4122911-Ditylum_brightwellii.AAC.1